MSARQFITGITTSGNAPLGRITDVLSDVIAVGDLPALTAADVGADASGAAAAAQAAAESYAAGLVDDLSGVTKPAAARGSLGLGGAATLNVGAVAGTVAAGDDPRFASSTTPADNSVTTAKIVDAAVTNAKLAAVATQTFKGRTSAGTGSPEDLTPAQATALLSPFTTTLKGVVPASGGGTSNFLRADATWAAPLLPRGYIDGLTLSYGGTNTVTFNPGVCVSSTGAFNFSRTTQASGLLQSSGGWSEVVGAGSIDTGTITASSWYHCFVISAGFATTVLFSLSPTSPTLPPGYTYFRRVGAVYVNASSQLVPWVQDGDYFQWLSPVQDVYATNPTTAAVTRTLSVPTGVRVQAQVSASSWDGGTANSTALGVYLSDLSASDVAASLFSSGGAFTGGIAVGSSTINVVGGSSASVWTNTAAQVRSRVERSTASTVLKVLTNGWRDPRGKDQ